MPEARTPTPNTHSFTGTHIGINSDTPVRVTVETETPVETWKMVPDSFFEQYIHLITDAPIRVMMQLFYLRCRFSSTVKISRADLISAARLRSKGALSDALKRLRELKLIEDLGGDVYVVMPGREFAGSHKRTQVRNDEQSFVNTNTVSGDRARAPEPPNQKKDRDESEEESMDAQGQECAARGTGSGGVGRTGRGSHPRVPDPASSGDLFVLDRTVQLRAALEACGINEPARSVLMDIADLTPNEVLACAKRVLPDQGIDNAPAVIAYRLLKARGMVMPKAVKKNNAFSDEDFAVIRRLKQMQGNRVGAGGRA